MMLNLSNDYKTFTANIEKFIIRRQVLNYILLLHRNLQFTV